MLRSLTTRIFAFCLALAAAVGLGAGSAQAADAIKVGSFLAITGPASFLGDPEAKTLKLYVDLINKEGGVLGRKIELTVYDSAGDAKQAATFARRLIEEDKVDIIVGGSSTGETMAVVPMVEEAQIPFISLAGANVIVEPVKKWVFKTPHSDRMAVEKIYADLNKEKLASIAIIAGSGGFDQSCRKEAIDQAKKLGIQVLADETYAATDTDMTPQLTRIRNNAGVQAVLNCGFGAAPVIVARNFRQLGMTLPFYFSHGVASKQFIDGAGGAAEGIRLPVAALLVAAQLSDSDPQKKVAQGYIDTYTKAHKEAVSTFGGHAYDGLMIAVEAIKRAGGTDKAKVRDEIEKTKGFIGADGLFNMSAADHMGLTPDSFKMVVVKDGNWKLLY